jgi:hypothetical protein
MTEVVPMEVLNARVEASTLEVTSVILLDEAFQSFPSSE